MDFLQYCTCSDGRRIYSRLKIDHYITACLKHPLPSAASSRDEEEEAELLLLLLMLLLLLQHRTFSVFIMHSS